MVVVNAPVPHVHAAIIKAWADGAQIERFHEAQGWYKIEFPCWDTSVKYRIKEAPKPDILHETSITLSPFAGPLLYPASPKEANCVLVFDGTTGKLKQCLFKPLKRPSEGFSNSSQWLGSLNEFKRTGEL